MTSKGCGKLCLDELPDVCTVRQVADVLRVAVLLEEALAVDLPWPGLADDEGRCV